MFDYIPPAIVEFADNTINYSQKNELHIIPQKNWKHYKVYALIDDSCHCRVCGRPRYFLYKKNQVRWANSNEYSDIFYMNKPNKNQNPEKFSFEQLWEMYCKTK